MKRSIILLAILLTSSITLQAQKKHLFEIGAGAVLPFSTMFHMGGPSFGGPAINAYGEYRYAIQDHIHLGGQLGYKAYSKGKTPMHMISAKAHLTANILPHKKVNPYAGLGIGYGFFTNGSNHFLLVPRIGIQIGKHLRIALEYDMAYENKSGDYDRDNYVPQSFNVAWTF
jgi:hypothetical protein